MCRCATVVRPRGSTRMLGAAQRGGHTVAVDTAGTHLHETARDGPQPETLFRPDVFALSSGHAAAAAAGSGGRGEGAKPLKEGELPGFGGLPVGPDYGAERPQEQAAPEPDNPLPGDLPPNHPKREGEEAPEGPGPVEVPSPRRDEPDVPLRPPPEVRVGHCPRCDMRGGWGLEGVCPGHRRQLLVPTWWGGGFVGLVRAACSRLLLLAAQASPCQR